MPYFGSCLFTVYVIPLALSAVAAGAISVYAWKQRTVHISAATLSYLMANTAFWLLVYVLEIISLEKGTKEFWRTLGIIAQGFMGPLWFIFAAQYAGLESWLLRQRVLLALSPGVLTALLAVSNSWHHLLWSGTILYTGGPFPTIFPVLGLWFWALVVYRYIYVLVGTSLILIPLVRSAAWYRKQSLFLVAGGVIPLVGNALHIFDVVHILFIDVGPIAFTLSGWLLSWGLFRYRLLDILPLAQRVVFQGMREGVIVLDSRNQVVDANPAARQMLGLPARYPASQIEMSSLPGEIRDLFQGGGGKEKEFRLGEGEQAQWLNASLTMLNDESGRQLGKLLVLRDVTEAHRLEELREDLMQMMVHDLRNPLTVVYGSAQLLEEMTAGQLDATGRKLVSMILASSMQCLDIVNRILDVNSLEQGQMMLELESLPVASLIPQVVQRMSPLAEMKQQHLQIQVPPGLPAALADSRMFERILQNLIGNAIKFSPAASTIRVGAQQAGNQLRIWVADNGPGIPAEMQERLFQKFVTGMGKKRGSGLGLAFCKLAVEAQGGTIWVESQEGQGSTFYFTLPLAETPQGPVGA